MRASGLLRERVLGRAQRCGSGRPDAVESWALAPVRAKGEEVGRGEAGSG